MTIGEVNRLVCYTTRCQYPWLPIIPYHWTDLVKFLEDYTSIVVTKIIQWKNIVVGYFKCYTDGVAKGNPRPSTDGFCVRDSEGNIIYVEFVKLLDDNNLIA